MEEDLGGSSACFAHLLVAGQPVDPETARDVATFRRAERERLMERRRAIRACARVAMTSTLSSALHDLVRPRPDLRIAVYWPIRGEPDLRGWMGQAHAAGAKILLPVVVRKDAPLIFREWSPGCTMERGIWNIPIPSDGGEFTPDTVVSPLLGVDDACFRLGNGGGYYDRTLAGLDPLPRVIGVGFSDCAIRTIFPMSWDIPMDIVILADGSVRYRP